MIPIARSLLVPLLLLSLSGVKAQGADSATNPSAVGSEAAPSTGSAATQTAEASAGPAGGRGCPGGQARGNLARTLILEGASDEAEALLDSAKGDEDRTPRNPCWRVWSR